MKIGNYSKLEYILVSIIASNKGTLVAIKGSGVKDSIFKQSPEQCESDMSNTIGWGIGIG